MAKEPSYVRIARANSDSRLHIKFAARIMQKLELSSKEELSRHYQRIIEQMAKSDGTYFLSRLKFKGY